MNENFDGYLLNNAEVKVYSEPHRTVVCDYDGIEISSLPAEIALKELEFWARAYDIGYRKGKESGENIGRSNLQRDLMKLLGVTDSINWLAEIVDQIPSS